MKLEDRQTSVASEVEGRGPLGATASYAAEDLDPGRERRPLESYFQEIGGTRTLRREEEVYLAKELEAATAALRGSLYRIPCSSRHVVERWDSLRALSHTGAKLSESMGDEETGEIAARVERAVKKLRVLHADRDKQAKRRATKAVERADEKIADEMEKAQLSLPSWRSFASASRPSPSRCATPARARASSPTSSSRPACPSSPCWSEWRRFATRTRA